MTWSHLFYERGRHPMANAEESAPADLSCTSAQQLLSQSM